MRAIIGFILALVITIPPVSCEIIGIHPAFVFPFTFAMVLLFVFGGAMLDIRAAEKRQRLRG